MPDPDLSELHDKLKKIASKVSEHAELHRQHTDFQNNMQGDGNISIIGGKVTMNADPLNRSIVGGGSSDTINGAIIMVSGTLYYANVQGVVLGSV